MAKDAITDLQVVDVGALLGDDPQAHIAEAAEKSVSAGLAAAVQAQRAVPAVGSIGGIGAKAAEFGAVFDRAEEAFYPYFIGSEGRFFILAEDGMSGAVGDEFERH